MAGSGDSHIPSYLFDKSWQEGNFLIPSDREQRVELRLKLERFSRYGVAFLPENTTLKSILKSRISALEAYDS